MTDCNTIEGIRSYLDQGLAGLHELANIRNKRGQAWVRDRTGQPLTDFLVHGHWMLDSNGHVGVAKLDFSEVDGLTL